MNALSEQPHRLAGYVLICLLIAIAYKPVLNAGYIWDDDDHLTANVNLRSGQGLWKIWTQPQEYRATQYYPLTFTTFWAEYHLWGLWPTGYHINNILLHCLNALLLWRILNFLKIPGSWLAAAIFALHPVNVESVAWITERKNTLSCFFYLCAFWSFLHFLAKNNKRYYFGSLWLYFFALTAKTSTCTFPVAMLTILWWQKGRINRKEVWALIPFFLLSIPMGLLTIWIEKHNAGATGNAFSYNFIERILIAAHAWWFYIEKILWPHPLAFFYPLWHISVRSLWQWGIVVSAAALLPGLWIMRKYIGRGPIAACTFFTITIAPALGFTNMYTMRFSFVADHFQYIAGIGSIVLFSALFVRLTERSYYRHIRCIGAGILLTVLLLLTWYQTHIYKDIRTLWQDTVAKNPNSAIVHNHLGASYYLQGERKKALMEFTKATELEPNYFLAYCNLGNIYSDQRQYELAISMYLRAISLEPTFAVSYNNLGNVYMDMGRYQDAINIFSKATEIVPDYSLPYRNLGSAYYHRQQFEKALQALEHYLTLKPEEEQIRQAIVDLHLILVKKYLRQRYNKQAMEHYNRAHQMGASNPSLELQLGIPRSK